MTERKCYGLLLHHENKKLYDRFIEIFSLSRVYYEELLDTTGLSDIGTFLHGEPLSELDKSVT